MAVQATDTNEGESNFMVWLVSKGINKETHDLLAEFDVKTIDDLKFTKEEDLKDMQINVKYRIKLRKIISSLQSQNNDDNNNNNTNIQIPIVIKESEQKAITELHEMEQLINNTINTLNKDITKLDVNVTSLSAIIDKEFNILYSTIKKRQIQLKNQLLKQAKTTKYKILERIKLLSKNKKKINETKKTCSILIKKTIQVHELTKREKEIIKLKDSVLSNNIVNDLKKNIHFDINADIIFNKKSNIIKLINNYGMIAGLGASPNPNIISIKQIIDKYGVNISWNTLNTNYNITNNDKIQILYKLGKYNDNIDEKQNDNIKWTTKEIKVIALNDPNQTKIDNIKPDNDDAIFAFKMRYYYSGSKWSEYSNITNFTIKYVVSFKGLNSVLIKGDKLKKLFDSIVPQSLKNKTFTLLLRASQHGMNDTVFQQRCRNKGETLVIASSNQYDRIFGGYTSVSWTSSNDYKNDSNAFVYYISENQNKAQRFEPKNQNGQYAVYNGSCVSFGGSGDLGWWNGKNGTCNRYQYNYSTATDNTKLAGGPNQWTVKEYEVWKVT